MNWVGGARNRMRMRDERKQQKEFFEKKRFTTKVAKALATMKSRSGASQDIISLNTIKKMHARKPSQETRVTRVDLDRARPATRRLEHVELSDVSPVKCVSKIPVMDAKESKKEQLQNPQQAAVIVGKPVQMNQLRSIWGPGPGNRRKELKTPLEQILPRKRSVASSMYALTSESVSLPSQKVQDDSQLDDRLSKPKMMQSECEGETPFIHSFKSHEFSRTATTAEPSYVGQYKTPSNRSWSSQQSYKQNFRDFAPRKSSLWSGCSFPSQTIQQKASSPSENLPDNFWKQPKPYPKDFDIFVSKKRIRELYQNDEPVRPKFKKHSEGKSESFNFAPEPASEDLKNDSDSLEILDDEAFNKQQPCSLTADDHLKMNEPMEANAAEGSPDLPIMGSRVFRGRKGSFGRSDGSDISASGSEHPFTITNASEEPPAIAESLAVVEKSQSFQQVQEDAPLDLSVKSCEHNQAQSGPEKDEYPLEYGSGWDAYHANGRGHEDETAVPKYHNLDEPLALLCSSKRRDFSLSCHRDLKINNMSTAISEKSGTDNPPIKSDPTETSSVPADKSDTRMKKKGSCDSQIKPPATGDKWTARQNYRSSAEKVFSFTKTPHIARKTTDSQGLNDQVQSNDDGHVMDTFPLNLTAAPKDCDDGITCNAQNGQSNGKEAMLAKKTSVKATGNEPLSILPNTIAFSGSKAEAMDNSSSGFCTVTSKPKCSKDSVDNGPQVEEPLYPASTPQNYVSSNQSHQTSNSRQPMSKSEIRHLIDLNKEKLNTHTAKKEYETPTWNKAFYPKKKGESQYDTPTISGVNIHKSPTNEASQGFRAIPWNGSLQESVKNAPPNQNWKSASHTSVQVKSQPVRDVSVSVKAMETITIKGTEAMEKVHSHVSKTPKLNCHEKHSPVELDLALLTNTQPDLERTPEASQIETGHALNSRSDSPGKETANSTAGGTMLVCTGENNLQVDSVESASDSRARSLSQLLLDSNTGDAANELSDTRNPTPQNGVGCSCERNSTPTAFEDVALSPFLIHSLKLWPEMEDFTQQFAPTDVVRTHESCTQCELLMSATFVHKFTQTDKEPEPVSTPTVSTAVQCEIICSASDLRPDPSPPTGQDVNVVTVQPENVTTWDKVAIISNTANLCSNNGPIKSQVECVASKKAEVDMRSPTKPCMDERSGLSWDLQQPANSAVSLDVPECKIEALSTSASSETNDTNKVSLNGEMRNSHLTTAITKTDACTLMSNTTDDKESLTKEPLDEGRGTEEPAKASQDDEPSMEMTNQTGEPSSSKYFQEQPDQKSFTSEKVSEEVHAYVDISDDMKDMNESQPSTQESVYESAEETPHEGDGTRQIAQKERSSKEPKSKGPRRSHRTTRSSTRWKPPVK